MVTQSNCRPACRLTTIVEMLSCRQALKHQWLRVNPDMQLVRPPWRIITSTNQTQSVRSFSRPKDGTHLTLQIQVLVGKRHRTQHRCHAHQQPLALQTLQRHGLSPFKSCETCKAGKMRFDGQESIHQSCFVLLRAYHVVGEVGRHHGRGTNQQHGQSCAIDRQRVRRASSSSNTTSDGSRQGRKPSCPREHLPIGQAQVEHQ